MNISNHTILITGGGSGIGLATAKALLAKNNKVIICGRNQAKLDQATGTTPGLHAIQCDISDNAQVATMIQKLDAGHGGISILINNAAIFQRYDIVGKGLTREQVSNELLINVLGPISLIDQFLPGLMKKPEAAIVNVSSGLAYVPLTSHAIYSATKAAVHSYTLSLRHQLKGSAVRIFELLPPLVDTEMVKDIKLSGKVKPEVVVNALLSGLANNKKEIRPGASKALYMMSRLMPGVILNQLNKDN